MAAQWVLVGTSHICSQGQNPDSLFSIVCGWGEVWGQGTIVCGTVHSEVLTSHLSFPHLNMTMLHDFFERIANHEYKEVTHFMVNDGHFPPKFLSLEDLSTYVSSPRPPKEIYGSNNDHFSITKLIRKFSDG